VTVPVATPPPGVQVTTLACGVYETAEVVVANEKQGIIVDSLKRVGTPEQFAAMYRATSPPHSTLAGPQPHAEHWRVSLLAT
jgi:hypothetical protein